MPQQEQKRNYFELFDVSKNSVIATLPLEEIKHMPRTGERIFLPLHEPEDWVAFKMAGVGHLGASKWAISKHRNHSPMSAYHLT
jgi:hypothetical protein